MLFDCFVIDLSSSLRVRGISNTVAPERHLDIQFIDRKLIEIYPELSATTCCNFYYNDLHRMELQNRELKLIEVMVIIHNLIYTFTE
jgi:hypothetical protein